MSQLISTEVIKVPINKKSQMLAHIIQIGAVCCCYLLLLSFLLFFFFHFFPFNYLKLQKQIRKSNKK